MQPLQKVYMAATAVMAQINAIGAMDAIRLSGTDTDGWYLDAPKEALASGDMIYAGKYSEPDYELLVQEGCDLAVESTMIDHSPEVKEKLEELGIPVLTDHSSYEDHPLGRAEWVRFYGALFDKESAADEQFAKQKDAVGELEGFENTGKTVCFFYIGQDGTAVVRSAEDYIPRMIEIAGGQYIFSDLEAAAGNSAAVNLSMEEFYATASELMPRSPVCRICLRNQIFSASLKPYRKVRSGRPIRICIRRQTASAILSGTCIIW